MKKIGFLLLSIGCILFTGCSTHLHSSEVSLENDASTTTEERSVEDLLVLLQMKAESWNTKLREKQIPMDGEGYYKLSVADQEDAFFLQRHTTNSELYVPQFQYRELEVISGGYAVIQEDEGLFPLGYKGFLDFYDTRTRYPFFMQAKFFKGFALKGEVKSGNIKIELIQKDYPNAESERSDSTKKEFYYKAGERFEIMPQDEFPALHDVANAQYMIHVLGADDEGAKVEYSFVFQDTTAL